MATRTGPFRTVRFYDVGVVAALLTFPLGMYLTAAWFRSRAHGTAISTVATFDPDAAVSFAGLATTIAMSVGAVAFLYVVPVLFTTLMFRRRPSKRSTAYVWGIGVNCAAIVLVCLLLRHTVGIERAGFVVLWWIWSLATATAACLAGNVCDEVAALWRRHRRGVLLGLATVAAGIVLFAPEQFLQCFNGDGTESWELARSLRDYFLPKLEATIDSGDVELATRLPFCVYCLGIFLVCDRLQRQSGQRAVWADICLMLSILMVVLWYTFYTGYDPYMADVAQPGMSDLLFTLFLVMGFDCLRQTDLSGWVLTIVLATFVLYAGPVIFVLTVLAALIWRPVERIKFFRAAILGGTALIAVAIFYLAWGWANDLLPFWWGTLQEEYVQDYAAGASNQKSGLTYLGYFVIGCGGIPAIGLLRAVRRSPWERVVATVVLAYLAIVLNASSKNLHYLGPLLPVSVLLWNLHGETMAHSRRRVLGWLSVVSMCICLWVCWPPERTTFTLARRLGHITTFQTDTDFDATRWAGVAQGLYQAGIMSWDMGPQTWVQYSQVAANSPSPRALIVANSAPPPGYVLLMEAPVASVYVRAADRIEVEQLLRMNNANEATGRFPKIFEGTGVLPQPRLRGLLPLPRSDFESL